MMTRKKGSLNFMKLSTLKVHVKLVFINVDFCREKFLMGLKIDFEFFNGPTSLPPDQKGFSDFAQNFVR